MVYVRSVNVTFCMVSLSFFSHSSPSVHAATPDGLFISAVTAGNKKLEMSVKTSLLSSIFELLSHMPYIKKDIWLLSHPFLTILPLLPVLACEI